MEPVTPDDLHTFLQKLGERFSAPVSLYLVGGTALALLGNPRTTIDVDYAFDTEQGLEERFEALVADLSAELKLDWDPVPIDQFVPLPPQARDRRRLIGRYGAVTVYIFDPYTIALSKISRGFEADLDDVMFLLGEKVNRFEELERHFEAVLPNAASADIIPDEFLDFFGEIRRRYESER